METKALRLIVDFVAVEAQSRDVELHGSV